MLELQIDRRAHQRSGKALNNFGHTLPPPDSDMAAQVFKDPYLFDFLGTRRPQPRARGRAGPGRPHPALPARARQRLRLRRAARSSSSSATSDFYVDLLFYHLKLRCYVVIELKAVPFDPGFVGQMNVYLSAVDDLLRHAGRQADDRALAVPLEEQDRRRVRVTGSAQADRGRGVGDEDRGEAAGGAEGKPADGGGDRGRVGGRDHSLVGARSVMHVSRTKGREATQGVIAGRFALSVGRPTLPEPSGRSWTALSEVAQLESGHTPSRRHPEYWDGEVPWIGIGDAVDNHGRTIHTTHQFVSEEGLANSSARLLPERTVCLSRTASVGYVVVLGRPMATSQDFVNWVCGPRIDSDFLKYVLLAERDSLLRFASGTTHQTIYYPEAKAFHVLLPSRQEQEAILAVLRPLDDKIELNRKMSKTLEQVARALFKSWFIDFDPVHAKAAGRKPSGMDAETAKLFPSEFEDSALGRIPRGWRVVRLDELVQLQRGTTYKSELLQQPGPYLLGLASIQRNGGFRSDSLRTYGGDSPSKILLRAGDLFVSLKDVTQAGDMLGAVARVPRWLGPGRLTQDTVKLDFISDAVPPEVVYRFLLSARVREDFRAMATGTTNLALSRDDFLGCRLAVPPTHHASSLARLIGLMSERIENANETALLTATRDELLPRLLSGELSVAHAEQLADAL